MKDEGIGPSSALSFPKFGLKFSQARPEVSLVSLAA